MTLFIICFGVLTFLAGLVIVINPEIIFGYLRLNLDKPGVHILAVMVRLVLGVLLVYQSSAAKFPVVIEVIGWLSIVAAITLTIIGRQNFNRLMSWALNFLKDYGRVGGILAATFGAFLIYAFV